MTRTTNRSARRDQRERGSILVMLSLIVFVFMSAAVALSSAQLMHARAAHAQYNKYLANMAAEAGVYATLEATQSLAPTELDNGNGRIIRYESRVSGPAPTFAIQSTGSVKVADGFTYRSIAHATVSNGIITQWSYGP